MPSANSLYIVKREIQNCLHFLSTTPFKNESNKFATFDAISTEKYSLLVVDGKFLLVMIVKEKCIWAAKPLTAMLTIDWVNET